MDIFNTDKYYVPKHKVPELIRMGFPEIENPLYEQAFEWFRDRHYFHYYFERNPEWQVKAKVASGYYEAFFLDDIWDNSSAVHIGFFDTYYEMLEGVFDHFMSEIR